MATAPPFTTTSRRVPPRSNGQGSGPSSSVAPPGGRVRKPELILGVLVMAMCALGAVLWHLRSIDRVPALAVASDVERGDTITDADIRVVHVSADARVTRLSDAERGDVVGRVALIDLAPGTLLTPSVVADQPAVGVDEAIVGLALDPGGYPATGLAPGDRVNVVRTTDPADPAEGNTEGQPSNSDEEPSDTVIATDATVVAVEELSSERRLVSILAPEAAAEAVAAAGSGTLRLVQVSP